MSHYSGNVPVNLLFEDQRNWSNGSTEVQTSILLSSWQERNETLRFSRTLFGCPMWSWAQDFTWLAATVRLVLTQWTNEGNKAATHTQRLHYTTVGFYPFPFWPKPPAFLHSSCSLPIQMQAQYLYHCCHAIGRHFYCDSGCMDTCHPYKRGFFFFLFFFFLVRIHERFLIPMFKQCNKTYICASNFVFQGGLISREAKKKKSICFINWFQILHADHSFPVFSST